MSVRQALPSCAAIVLAVIWVILLLSSLLFGPGKERKSVRMLEKMLVVTSVLLILAIGAMGMTIAAAR